eukprot:12379373-Alexandrium_andersonii.AAC.1
MSASLVGSEMCIRDRCAPVLLVTRRIFPASEVLPAGPAHVSHNPARATWPGPATRQGPYAA